MQKCTLSSKNQKKRMISKVLYKKSRWNEICFVFLDTAILTQSRFILMESMMMCFGLGALLSVLKFRKVSRSLFTGPWFLWLLLASILSTAAFRSNNFENSEMLSCLC